MTRIFLTSIVALLLATGTTAHAGHREQAILGKPRIIVRHITIRGSLQPPSKYDVPYTGELEILLFCTVRMCKQLVLMLIAIPLVLWFRKAQLPHMNQPRNVG